MDIRELIKLQETQGSTKLVELGYTKMKVQASHFNANQELQFWVRGETTLVITLQQKYCVAVTVFQPHFQEIKDWLESSTTIIKNPSLQPAPEGMKTEVREDEDYWYSIRHSAETYTVTITRKDFVPPGV